MQQRLRRWHLMGTGLWYHNCEPVTPSPLAQDGLINMKNIMDFLSAALPWICIGLLLAIFFAQSVRKKKDKKKDNKKNENYGTEGMALGMCFGTAIGISLGNNTGIGLSLGMLAGLVIGSCIAKKKNDDEE